MSYDKSTKGEEEQGKPIKDDKKKQFLNTLINELFIDFKIFTIIMYVLLTQ